jgi:hypothetical protein
LILLWYTSGVVMALAPRFQLHLPGRERAAEAYDAAAAGTMVLITTLPRCVCMCRREGSVRQGCLGTL